jgi:hypothetical protein
MGLHLDWEIEAEQSTVRGHKEDRRSARARRLARLRLLLGIIIVLGMLAAIYGVFAWRLRVVDAEIRRALQDTVQAEVTTLRIADRNAFLNIQRSASDAWIQQQAATFDAYQRLKNEQDIQLTGNIVNIDVNGPRGRVQVQEIIDGVPYVRTWFYWRYAGDEGWRHVPPDYTYWGDPATIEAEGVVVNYQALDEPVAIAISEHVSQWLSSTCAILPCDNLPLLNVQITPQPELNIGWDETAPWTLRVPSPYVGIARADRPFDTPLRTQTANLIASRLLMQATGSIQPTYPADAVFVRGAVQTWLVGRYTDLDTASHLISSYANYYGPQAVGQVLQGMSPGSDIRVLLAPAGADALNNLAVDWRDYLTWRLNLENELHQQRNQVAFVALYDTRLGDVANIAFSRFEQARDYQRYEVTQVQPVIQPDGTPALQTIVQVGEADNTRQEEILFRLSDGVWKRAN